MVEFYISIFLLMYAADAMGIMISCLVKKEEAANVLAPYILIVQLIFSGILFAMEGMADYISYVMTTPASATVCTTDCSTSLESIMKWVMG